MKRILLTLLILAFALPAFADPLEHFGGTAPQVFVPTPAKSQTNSAMTGTITFTKGAGGTVNITGWSFIRVDPTADATYYYNTDSAKTYPLRSGTDNLIAVYQLATGESVVCVLGAATASVQAR
jgi:hypothetical protein